MYTTNRIVDTGDSEASVVGHGSVNLLIIHNDLHLRNKEAEHSIGVIGTLRFDASETQNIYYVRDSKTTRSYCDSTAITALSNAGSWRTMCILKISPSVLAKLLQKSIFDTYTESYDPITDVRSFREILKAPLQNKVLANSRDKVLRVPL